MSQFNSIGRRSIDLARVYEKIARVLLYLAIGLVPITYLPWTVDGLEINKQTILLFCTAFAVIAWLGAMVARKAIDFRKSYSVIFAVLFILIALMSSFLSISSYTSWIGQSGQEYTSFVTILSFVLMFIVGSNLLSATASQKNVWTISLIVSGVISLFAIMEVFGIELITTNLIGAPSALGLYLTVMSIMGSALLLVGGRTNVDVLERGLLGWIAKISIITTIVATVIVLVSLDFWVLWLAVILGVSMLFIFALFKAQEFPQTSRFVLPMVLFVIALLFLFLPTFINGVYPGEVAPSYSASWRIAGDTLQDTSWLFGSGPGTFVMDYTKYHLASVNSSELWDVRFDRSSSHLLTMLASFGVTGLVIYILFILFLAGSALKMLIKEQPHDEWKMTFVAFSGWTVLVAAQFVYSSNLTLSFMFWWLSAILLSQIIVKVKSLSFNSSPRSGLVTIFLFVLVNVAMLTMIFVTASRYAAEITFAKAVAADQAGADLDSVVLDLENAARLNRQSDVFARNLGNAYLLKTAQLLEDENADPNYISAFISGSINEAARAVELSPSNVTNWVLLGDIYREFSPLISGADDFAINSYEKAVELSPNNPKYLVALSRAYMARADNLSVLMVSDDEEFTEEMRQEYESSLQLAETVLEQAINLKPDYTPSHYYLALVYERQGNLNEAISRMEAISAASPYDVGVLLQLGLLYLQQGKSDLAQVQFESALELAPNFANARWYLAAVYEQEGDIEAAIEQIEILLEADPENSLIIQKLERLQAGLVEQEVPKPLTDESGAIIEE